MRRIALILGVLVSFAVPAAAQRDSTRTFAPSHLAAARELLTLIRMEEVSMGAVATLMDQQTGQNPAMKPYRAVMMEWVRGIFASEEARNAFARLYAESLSEADIRALVEFYRTPAGQRFAAAQPAMAARGAELGQSLAMARQGELVRKLEALRVDEKP